MLTEQDEEFSQAYRLYARAEKAIKRTERYMLKMPVAPVNQLRYAGFHLLKAHKAALSGNAKDFQTHIDRAKNHCRRSWIDAFEDAALYSLSAAESLNKALSASPAFLINTPELVELEDEAGQVVDYIKHAGLGASMTLKQRVGIWHRIHRMGILKRRALRLYSSSGRGGSGTISTKKRAKNAERVFKDRQFLVPLAATLCGTIVGVISFAGFVWSASKESGHQGWWTLASVLVSIGATIGLYFLLKPFMLPPED